MKLLFAKTAEGVKFYPITIAEGVIYKPEGGEAVKLNVFLDSLKAANDKKADKLEVGEGKATAGNFMGIGADGNIVDSGKKAADFEDAGTAQNLIDALGGSASQEAADSNGNIAATVTSEKGEVKTISVDASALKTACETDATTKANAAQAAAEATAAADAAAKDTALEEKLVGDADTDTKASDTITGAKKYAKDLADDLERKIVAGKAYQGKKDTIAELPTDLTADDAGKYYIVNNGGNVKFAYWNGTGWDLVDQEVAVNSEDASLVIGTPTKVAEVEGVEIKVTQVEDMTKIEAEACGDTTEYPDYSSLFTTPAGE